ncbi:MAG: hypothetical protein AB8H80_18525 [Planctomycetota bacterium]
MLTRTHKLFAPLVLLAGLASCGADANANANAGPIAGHWAQETGTEKKGMTVQFDSESNKVMVHTAPAEDGSHGHVNGTYTFDAESNEVNVQCALNGKDKSDAWKGKLDGEHLSLTGGDETLKFHKGSDPHEHK